MWAGLRRVIWVRDRVRSIIKLTWLSRDLSRFHLCPVLIMNKSQFAHVGKSERDYRIQFTLDEETNAQTVASEPPTFKIKNIQLFRTNFECESTEFPGVCDRAETIIPKLSLCKAKWTPCLASPCLNGGLCMNEISGYKCVSSHKLQLKTFALQKIIFLKVLVWVLQTTLPS